MLIRLDNENYINIVRIARLYVEAHLSKPTYCVMADDDLVKEVPTKDEACAYLESICRKMCYFSLEENCVIPNYNIEALHG